MRKQVRAVDFSELRPERRFPRWRIRGGLPHRARASNRRTCRTSPSRRSASTIWKGGAAATHSWPVSSPVAESKVTTAGGALLAPELEQRRLAGVCQTDTGRQERAGSSGADFAMEAGIAAAGPALLRVGHRQLPGTRSVRPLTCPSIGSSAPTATRSGVRQHAASRYHRGVRHRSQTGQRAGIHRVQDPSPLAERRTRL